MCIESLALLLEDLSAYCLVSGNAFRVKFSAAALAALDKLRRIVLLNLDPILPVKLLDILFLVNISSPLQPSRFILRPSRFILRPPRFILWLLPILLLLRARLRLGTLVWPILLVFLPSFVGLVILLGVAALFRWIVIRRIVLLHLLVDVFV